MARIRKKGRLQSRLGLFASAIVMILLFCVPARSSDIENLAKDLLSEQALVELERLNEALLSHDVAYFRQTFDPRVVKNGFDQSMAQVFAMVPESGFVEREMGSARAATYEPVLSFSGDASSHTDYRVEYQYEFADAWLYVSVLFREQAGKLVLRNLNVNRLPEDLRVINAFHLEGKPISGYLFLAGMALTSIFVLGSFVFALIQVKGIGKKLLWGFFILLCVGSIDLNWTTQAYHIALVKVSLFGFGFVQASSLGPWMMSLSFPLGATVFWLRRWWVKRKKPVDRLSDTSGRAA